MSELYGGLLEDLVEEAKRDEGITGILLTGSLARGDALPGTDIDLRFVLADGLSRPSHSGLRDGVLVERGYADEAAARATLDQNPMHVYAYLDGRILYDATGALPRLGHHARHRFDTYQVTDHERSDLAARLRYPRDKIRVALGGGDLLKAAFVTGTSSWAIMEGLWAANNRPLPPNSSVQPHLRDLAGPPDVQALYRRLFLSQTHDRVVVALTLFDWILDQLT